MKKIIYTIAFIGLISGTAINKLSAQSGSLDPTFSADGKATMGVGTSNGFATAVAIQSDGKIVIAGYTNSGGFNYDFAVVRLNTDGSVDNTFGSGGSAIADFFGGDDRPTSIGIQSDGKIVITGTCHNGSTPHFGLVRFNADGTLDNSFDTDGKVTLNFGGSSESGDAMAIQSDGKIVAVGSVNNGAHSDFAIARLNTNGSLDNSFDLDGMTTTDFAVTYDYGYAVTIQSDGKIVVSGMSQNADGQDFAMTRYTTSGALDAGFGMSGKVVTDLGSVYDESHAVVMQSDGKIISAGIGNDGSTDVYALVRYNNDGTIDSGFDFDGVKFTSIGSSDVCYAATIQDDGKIIAAGISVTSLSEDFSVVRYNIDGSLDNSFDTDGKVTTDFGTSNDEAYGVALQSDGKIVVVGSSIVSSANVISVARYNAAAVNVSERTESMLITTYPEPVSNELIVAGTKEAAEIRITDITGKQVMFTKANEEQTIIDCGCLKSGYYILNYRERNKNVKMKIVKE